MTTDMIEQALEGLETELKGWLHKLRRHFPWHPRCHRPVKGILTVLINNQYFFPMNNVVYQLPTDGSAIQATPLSGQLLDAQTLKAIPGATYVRRQLVSDNPAVAVPDSNGNALPTGTPGVANFTATDEWSYNDQDTGQAIVAKKETATIGFTVTSGPEQVVEQLSGAAPVPAGQPTTGTFSNPPAAAATT